MGDQQMDSWSGNVNKDLWSGNVNKDSWSGYINKQGQEEMDKQGPTLQKEAKVFYLFMYCIDKKSMY